MPLWFVGDVEEFPLLFAFSKLAVVVVVVARAEVVVGVLEIDEIAVVNAPPDVEVGVQEVPCAEVIGVVDVGDYEVEFAAFDRVAVEESLLPVPFFRSGCSDQLE